MRLKNKKTHYGFYGINVYILGLAFITLVGSALSILGAWKGLPGISLLGLFIIFYGAASTFGWLLARYVIPRSPVIFAREVIRNLNLNGQEVVLDVGTGRGLYAIEIAKKLTEGSVIAIDLWESKKIVKAVFHHKWAQPTGNTIENARRNAELEGVQEKVKFKDMDANDLDFDPNTFDLAICAYLLGHLGDYAGRVLAEIQRVLKPHGRLLIIDNVRDLTFFFLSTPHFFLLSYLRGKKAKRLTEGYWLSLITKSGFSIARWSKGKGIILLEVEPRNNHCQ